MTEKRTLVNALTMTPEQRAFIGGRPTPTPVASPELDGPPDRDARTEWGSQRSDFPDDSSQNHSTTAGSPRRRRLAPRKFQDAPTVSNRFRNLRMPLTTSLRPETLDALRRLSLERRLSGIVPSAIQEIVEEALEQWLSEQ